MCRLFRPDRSGTMGFQPGFDPSRVGDHQLAARIFVHPVVEVPKAADTRIDGGRTQVVLVAVLIQMADRLLVRDLQRHFANVFHQVAHRARVSDDGTLGPPVQEHVFP